MLWCCGFKFVAVPRAALQCATGVLLMLACKLQSCGAAIRCTMLMTKSWFFCSEVAKRA